MHAMQMQPGVYNETAFLGLDTAIYEASRAGLRVIIVLANNWDYCGDWKWVTTSHSGASGLWLQASYGTKQHHSIVQSCIFHSVILPEAVLCCVSEPLSTCLQG